MLLCKYEDVEVQDNVNYLEIRNIQFETENGKQSQKTFIHCRLVTVYGTQKWEWDHGSWLLNTLVDTEHTTRTRHKLYEEKNFN